MAEESVCAGMDAFSTFIGHTVATGLGICVCGCYRGAVSVSNPFVSRLWHIFLSVAFVALAYFCTQWGQEWIQHFPILNSLCPSDVCGVLLVYRLSLAFTVFYLGLAFLTIGAYNSSAPAAPLQHGCWGIKFPALLLLVVVAGFVPESILLVYEWLVLGMAMLFLVIQLVLVVDFSYTIVDHSAQMRYTARSPSVSQVYDQAGMDVPRTDVWTSIFIVSTLFMIVTALVMNAYMIYLLEELPNCHPNIVIICLNFAIIVAITYGSINNRVRKASGGNGGIFQASLVALYGTYLTWNAVIVNDPASCTAPYVHGGTIYWFTVLVGLLYGAGLVFFSSLPRVGCNSDEYSYSKVNLINAFAPAYFAMLVTNWSIVQRSGEDASQEVETSMGWLPVIVYIFSLVVLALYYIFSLVGPVCWPEHFQRSIRNISERISDAVEQDTMPSYTTPHGTTPPGTAVQMKEMHPQTYVATQTEHMTDPRYGASFPSTLSHAPPPSGVAVQIPSHMGMSMTPSTGVGSSDGGGGGNGSGHV